MVKPRTLAVILVICGLLTASTLVYLVFFYGTGGSVTTIGCVGGACTTTSTPDNTSTTTTTTSFLTTTTTGLTSTTHTTTTLTTTTRQTSTTGRTTTTTTTTYCCNSSQKMLGFWIDSRDMWSGTGLDWTPQQFVTNYFLTPPYPSAMLFSTGMSPSGPDSPGPIGEADWLSQVATLAATQAPNAKILLLFFVNLSGNTINGTPDQTTLLVQYMAALGSHGNILGAEYEKEYFGNTIQEVTTFRTIIKDAGYANILDPSMLGNFPTDPVLDYSEYPYFNATIPTSLPSGNRSIGVGYGETGTPTGSTPNPAWTQTSVQAIIDNSSANPFVLMYASDGGTGQPAFELWNWSTLRQWIWADPYYQVNFIMA